MKVSNAMTYLSGFPANDSYYIDLDSGMSLVITSEQYKTLCESISAKNLSDIEVINRITEKYQTERESVSTLVKDLRNIFYEYFGDMLIRKSVDEIDKEALYEIITKADKLFGLE